MSFGWPAGATTGIGSLPGTDAAEAIALLLGEVSELPYLPELPGRGFGADLIAHGCALLLDLPVEWQPHGWTLASHPGRDLGRARDHLLRDLDVLTEQAQGVDLLKIQVAGPMTMAANLELPNLHKVLTDPGAFRALAESLTEGVRAQLADLSGRLPGTRFVLQVDEPSLPQVLAGQVPTPSGYGTVRSMERPVAEAALAGLLAVVEPGWRVVHCCGAQVPYELIGAAGASAVSVDASLIRDQHLDAIGALVDDGAGLWLGVIPGTDAEISVAGARAPVRSLWNKLGFAPQLLAERVVLTPSCGLAGASMPYVRRAISILRDAGKSLIEE
ncbi:MAG: methionine synthase [Actinomycetota bacterium]|nr:methionine synthase [Actinomycetota bacterium]MDQ2957252.1 methionine synthase [Actinomycetota bacterium]